MDLQRAAELYNLCNPDEPLLPDDPRNVDIDPSGVRGERWADRLARGILLSKKPVTRLFTGLRGTGKSTELRRLCGRLEEQGYFPVLVDADVVLDLTTEVDVSDILALVLQQVASAVATLEGRSTKEPLREGPLKRLWTWLTTTDVEIAKITLADTVELDLKNNQTLRQRVRAAVSAQTSSFLALVADELRHFDARVRSRKTAGLVVIFDSLEKLRGTSLTWKPVLDSAERIFANDAPYLQLPVHALYTVPPALTRRMNTVVSFLPMIKIHDRQGVPHQAGYDVARDLLRRRIPDSAMAELFGPLAEARVRELVSWSGGYPRELVRLLQSLLEEEALPITEQGLRHILNRAGNTYRGIVHDSGAIAWLGSVAHHKAMIVRDDHEREAADLFLQNNVVLRYLNQEEWFELHPSVQEMPEVAVARAAFVKASLGEGV